MFFLFIFEFEILFSKSIIFVLDVIDCFIVKIFCLLVIQRSLFFQILSMLSRYTYPVPVRQYIRFNFFQIYKTLTFVL